MVSVTAILLTLLGFKTSKVRIYLSCKNVIADKRLRPLGSLEDDFQE